MKCLSLGKSVIQNLQVKDLAKSWWRSCLDDWGFQPQRRAPETGRMKRIETLGPLGHWVWSFPAAFLSFESIYILSHYYILLPVICWGSSRDPNEFHMCRSWPFRATVWNDLIKAWCLFA